MLQGNLALYPLLIGYLYYLFPTTVFMIWFFFKASSAFSNNLGWMLSSELHEILLAPQTLKIHEESWFYLAFCPACYYVLWAVFVYFSSEEQWDFGHTDSGYFFSNLSHHCDPLSHSSELWSALQANLVPITDILLDPPLLLLPICMPFHPPWVSSSTVPSLMLVFPGPSLWFLPHVLYFYFTFTVLVNHPLQYSIPHHACICHTLTK